MAVIMGGTGVDNTPPTMTSAVIPSLGTTVALNFDEQVIIGVGGSAGWTLTMSGGAVTMTYDFGSGADTLIYNLNRTIGPSETGTVTYTQPGSGIRDLSGNDLVSIVSASVTNNAQDIIAPTLTSVTIPASGVTVSLVFSEAVTFGTGGNTGWTITMSGGAATMTYASGGGTATLVYNLNRTVGVGETGTLDYTQPGNGVEDVVGNDLTSISSRSVTNSSTQDITLPTLSTAVIPTAGTTISLAFSEAVTFGAGGNGGWSLTMSGGAVTPTYASGSGTATLVYSLSRTIEVSETGTISYTQPGNGVEDTSGNDLVSLGPTSITNNSTQDITVPTLSSATIPSAGTTISLVFSENVTFGAGGNGGWTLAMTGGVMNGAAVTMAYSSGDGASTLVYTLSRKVFSDETGTVAYTQPGNGVEDASGNDLATIATAAVTNSSTQVWTPLEIAGLVLWLKADAITGLSDGDPVGTWPDTSGLGNNFTQSGASRKPTFKENQINGYPSVQFDGSEDRLVHAGLAETSTTYVAAVFQNDTGVTGYRVFVRTTQSGNFLDAYASHSTTNAAPMTFGDFGEIQHTSVVTSYKVVEWLVSTTQKIISVDGSDVTSGTGTSLDTPITSLGGASQFFKGFTPEVVVFSGATITSTNRANTRTYMKTRYGI